MSCSEYIAMKIHYSVSPYGHEIEDMQNALLCALLAHSKDVDAFRCCKPPPKRKSQEEVAEMMMAYFTALGSVNSV